MLRPMRVVSSLKAGQGRLVDQSWCLEANRSCFLGLKVRGRTNDIKAFIIKTHLLVTKNGLLFPLGYDGYVER